MNRINDNYYINASNIAAVTYANEAYSAYLTNGKIVDLSYDEFNELYDSISEYEVSDYLFVNSNAILFMNIANAVFTITLAGGKTLEVSEDDWYSVSDTVEKYYVSDTLCVNPNKVIALNYDETYGKFTVLLAGGITLEVTEEEYDIIAEMQPSQGGGSSAGLKASSKLTIDFSKAPTAIATYGGDPDSMNLWFHHIDANNGVLRNDATAIAILLEVNEAGTQILASLCFKDQQPYQAFTNQVVIYQDLQGGLDNLEDTSSIKNSLPTVEFTNFTDERFQGTIIGVGDYGTVDPRFVSIEY